MLSTLLSSVFPTAYAEEEQEKAQDESKEEGGEEGAAAEEEEDEPEDIAPALREECTQSAACAGFDKHFQHCTEKVTSGQGYKGEDCVEEL
ncbi:ubiquinol-cytochrome C reductase hinge protein [Ceratobasidium sp. AG-Ba]|nr:ubiquinol-cytochrome C reductase hinge protein [Ceratobasidium sp. AG-Ba]QRV99351.1 ubiquinol-cytochrome C reductase hinge protein [Ceratobasidium sp. AG-Ba]QRW13856.1 ubiquinol-cytochrome C reductase hinge protein [Ceratobasidium sp. AG-Ba]